ncbi:MaoC family dehydratase [Candidatus Nitrosotenuis aquarius]|uniref:MaoC family dehydratase n=1 Tax=Candidatus Nitrosotenuis aquarius TaxID=1846278 RepID=UPI000C1E4949|nr:MaoC family dehydratase [Candidatus Nitrosotenuis aquarius]
MTFESIKLGQTVQFEIKIDEITLNDFAKLSGDYNPLHMDDDYAKSTKFEKRVCHGMLLASYLSRLVGMHLPGKNALYFSQTLNFRLPCFIDDQIVIKGEVIEKHETTKIITLKTTIANQTGKCLIDGLAKVLVRQ